METLHEKKKRIQRKLHKAEAIEGYLIKADQDYKDGYYLDSADAAERACRLDFSHPESYKLKYKAENKAEESKPRRKYENKPRKKYEDVDCEENISSATASIISYSTVYDAPCNESNSMPISVLLKWFFYAACAAAVCLLSYFVLKNYVIPTFIWLGSIVSVVAGYIWAACKVIYLLVAAVVKFLFIFFAFLFYAIAQIVEWIVIFFDWLRDGVEWWLIQ